MKTSNAISTLIAAALVSGVATSAFALNPEYFGDAEPKFVNPPWWSVTLPDTAASHQWDTFTNGQGGADLAAGFQNYSLSNGLALPSVSASGLNTAIYHFSSADVTATIPNYGGPAGTLEGGTYVTIQIAATIGANLAMPGPGDELEADYSILPGSLHLTDVGGNPLAGGAANEATYQLLDSYEGTFEIIPGFPATGEQHLFSFFLPDWTGDFNVTWTQQNHSVFDALRVDTQVVVPEPAGFAALGVAGCLMVLRRKRRSLTAQ